jgi:hypothetical protein
LKNFFSKSRMRISAGVGKLADQVTVIFIDHLPRFTPLFMALPEGVRVRFIAALFYGRLVTSWAGRE